VRPALLTILGVAGLVAVGCGATSATTAGDRAPAPEARTDAAVADSVRHSYTQADVDFMTGMIHHHAQALLMAEMAPSHDAGPALRIMADRIHLGQTDEITLMERWLRDNDQPIPDSLSIAMHVRGGGHEMHMPGMLSAEQLAELDAARGTDFDRLFLTYMIGHHQGAITMVDELFASHGGAQGDAVFKLASDIAADQNSEITRMKSMLQDMMVRTSSTP
jgi:uncharacterized protein (DUF305 family)